MLSGAQVTELTVVSCLYSRHVAHHFARGDDQGEFGGDVGWEMAKRPSPTATLLSLSAIPVHARPDFARTSRP
jgi:hypothetical protein